jgi:hypothetical protein
MTFREPSIRHTYIEYYISAVLERDHEPGILPHSSNVPREALSGMFR